MRRLLLSVGVAMAAAAFLSVALAAEKAAGPVAIGGAAPAFTLEDQTGKAVSLADYKGKIVVLEWINRECPFVVRVHKAKIMENLAQQYKGSGVVWLAINSTKGASNEVNKQTAEGFGLSYPVLNDSAGDTGHAYGAKTTPHMFVIDKEGTLVYRGAIDNDPAGREAKPTNYVAAALDEVIAGKAVSTPETKSYGCSVKYAK